TIQSMDEGEHTVSVRAEGSETRGRGGASATMTAQLQPTEKGTSVVMNTDLAVSGVVAQFGRTGIMQEVAQRMAQRFASCVDQERGSSSSIAIGVRALPQATDAGLIGVADQPFLTAGAIQALVKAFSPERIIVPRWGEHRGNPPVFDRRFFPELLTLSDDNGGQLVIAAHADAVTEVPFPAGLGDDIDRPEEWPR